MSQGEQPIRYDQNSNVINYGHQGRSQAPAPTSQVKIVPPQGGSGTAPSQSQNNQPKK